MATNIQKIQKIGILGGGISGLSSAFFLNKRFPDAQITIIEKESEAKGALSTKLIGSQVYDQGPRSLKNGNSVRGLLQILEEANHLDQIIPSQEYDYVYLYYDNKMRMVPRGKSLKVISKFIMDHPKLFKSAFNIKLSDKQKLEGDMTINDFVHQKCQIGPLKLQGLGDFLSDYFANAVFAGIYRGSSEDLSADVCLKQLYRKQYFSKNLDKSEELQTSDALQSYIDKNIKQISSFNFKEGLETLPKSLLQIFKQKKGQIEIQTNSEIKDIVFNNNQQNKIKVATTQNTQDFDMVVSALHANQLGQILNESKSQDLKQQLQSIKHLTTLTTNIGYKDDVIPQEYKCFGALVPYNQNFPGLGLILNSGVFPQFGGNFKSNISLFLSEHVEQQARQDDQKIQKIVQQTLKDMLGIQQDPDYFGIKNWQDFFPLYEKNHLQKVYSMFKQANELNPNFYLHGNYLFTGAIPDLILTSEVIANIAHKKQK